MTALHGETQMPDPQRIEAQQNPHQPGFLRRHLGSIALGLAAIASVNPLVQAFSGEEPAVHPGDDINPGELHGPGAGYTTTIEDKLPGMGLEHSNDDVEKEVPLAEKLKQATVDIGMNVDSTKDGWVTHGKGAVVIGQTLDGQEAVFIKSSAHIFDLKRETTKNGQMKITTPIRDSLKEKGNQTVVNILPYLENEYKFSVPNQTDVTMEDIERIMVSAQNGEDEDQAVIILRPGQKADALRGVALEPNYEQPQPGDRILIGQSEEGDPQYGTWMGTAVAFTTKQQSGFIAVPHEIAESECNNSNSGRVFMTDKGLAPGTLYARFSSTNPADAARIADIKQLTGQEPDPGEDVCQLRDEDYRIPELIGS